MHIKDKPAGTGHTHADSTTSKQSPNLSGAAVAGGSMFEDDFTAQMQALPTTARLTHVPVLGLRVTPFGFSTAEPALYWSVPTSHVVRAEAPGEEFDLVEAVLPQFVERASFRMALNGCPCRLAFDCQRFSQELGCMALGESMRPVPESDGHPVAAEEAMEHVRRRVANGLVPTISWEFDVGVYGGPLDRGLALCFCDWCCCDLRMSARVGNDRFRRKYQRIPGLMPKVSEACDRCEACTREVVCCVGAVTLSAGEERAFIDEAVCIRCGRCAEVCPKDAITFEIAAGIDVAAAVWDKVAKVTDIVNPEPVEYEAQPQ